MGNRAPLAKDSQGQKDFRRLTLSSKRRVYEVARDLGIDNKALIAALGKIGVSDVKNHMSVLSPDDEDRVKKHLGKGGSASSDIVFWATAASRSTSPFMSSIFLLFA